MSIHTARKAKKTILHVDINSYFATVLQQENPHLRGKPLGVIKDVGRTCLIATSKEAKQLGIGTGSRSADALRLCPKIILVPAAFDRYLDLTKRLQKLFLNIAPSVFIYSLDEAFIDITDCRTHLYSDVGMLAEQIHTRIKQELGEWVTCNIGIAENRFLAKMASETAAKGTSFEVTEENKDAILARTEFKDVCGIGYRLSKKLHRFNIRTPYQLRFWSEQELNSIVGQFWAQELLKMAYGKEPHFLELLDSQPDHMKSVGRSITGYRLYSESKEITAILKNLCIEVIDKVRVMHLSGRQVLVGLYGQETAWHRHITLQTPVNHASELMRWVEHLYAQWPQDFRVIKFWVRLALLQPQVQEQLLPEWKKQESIQKALDAINQKYGIFTVHPAALPAKKELIRPEVTGFLGDRTYQLRN